MPGQRHELTGDASELSTVIADLYRQGFRLVRDREPRRVREYRTTPVDRAAHVHKLEWIAPRPKRSRRRVDASPAVA